MTDREEKEGIQIYKLPLGDVSDSDLIAWIGSLPRNKKAEILRHGLRFYKSHLKDGEFFYYPPPVNQQQTVLVQAQTPAPELPPQEKKKVGLKQAGTDIATLRNMKKVQD